MVKRKTPYRHPVGAHTRDGKPIGSYERGKGDRLGNPRKSRVVGDTVSVLSSYNVTVNYVSKTEKLNVDAKNYLGALDRGLEERERTDRPKSISMRMMNQDV